MLNQLSSKYSPWTTCTPSPGELADKAYYALQELLNSVLQDRVWKSAFSTSSPDILIITKVRDSLFSAVPRKSFVYLILNISQVVKIGRRKNGIKKQALFSFRQFRMGVSKLGTRMRLKLLLHFLGVAKKMVVGLDVRKGWLNCADLGMFKCMVQVCNLWLWKAQLSFSKCNKVFCPAQPKTATKKNKTYILEISTFKRCLYMWILFKCGQRFCMFMKKIF